MKSILTTLLLLTVSLNTFAQTAEWTKSDRNVLFEEYNSFLVSYKNLSQDQRESLSLCCLDETTKAYTKSEYNSKIEIELKRIKEATINQCAKNMGVELKKGEIETEIKVETSFWSKEDKSKLAKSATEFLEDYEQISSVDKEKIVLCYIEEVTSKKSKSEYELLIELELRQLKTTTISKCAKKLNISMDAPAKIEKPVEQNNRTRLVGIWTTDQNYVIQIKDDGTFTKTFTSNFKTSLKKGDVDSYISKNTTSGNWFLDNSGVITMNESVQLEWYYDRRKGRETYYYNYQLQSTWLIEELGDKNFKINYLGGATCCPMNSGYSNAEITYPRFILGNKQ